ncbi:type II toxin-antitoxin system RnlA family toxin [Paenibacillus tyrfis]|uniref:Bacterial toxin RNase RnlA/LsoA DBD domain-containing protein n=1 Tax=Paenibacillus tyrfis TaxID=1501230 RepID=A0A081P3B2_9BACL|nr:type II toxin-antitoxin system RnlA family toxin [Paenibacillus tyrfis]KEQ25185.1 hypothetical protein ET33_03755 [Paenibacillus tyrfis]
MKNLNLNRDNLIQSIQQYYSLNGKEATISDFLHKGGTRQRVDIVTEDGSVYIDFHFNKNGSTTIDISGGGHHKIKEEISRYIIEDPSCAIGDVHSKSKCFVAPNIELDDFRGIVELLKESTYYQSESHSEDIRGNHELHKMRGSYMEEITAHYYYTTKKVMIQGRPLMLFSEAVSYITELLELNEIPSVFNNYYNVEIKKENIEQVYVGWFPNSHDKHSPKLKKVLHQAIYNLQLEGDMFDYTYLAFPALRALEGHLKTIMTNHRIILENNRFSMYTKVPSTGKYILEANFITTFNSQAKVQYVERAYNFYNSNRHSLFHWGDPSHPVDLTQIIENIGDVKGIIKSTFQIIDEYYTI